MRPRPYGAGLAAALAFLVAVATLSAAQGALQRRSVYVVAVRDSGLLTMCPETTEVTLASGWRWAADGRARVHPLGDDLQVLHFPSLRGERRNRRGRGLEGDPRFNTERSATVAVLPVPAARDEERVARDQTVFGRTELGRERITLDADVKAGVERELVAQGVHNVVDTPDEADTVFLVEA